MISISKFRANLRGYIHDHPADIDDVGWESLIHFICPSFQLGPSSTHWCVKVDDSVTRHPTNNGQKIFSIRKVLPLTDIEKELAFIHSYVTI